MLMRQGGVIDDLIVYLADNGYPRRGECGHTRQRTWRGMKPPQADGFAVKLAGAR